MRRAPPALVLLLAALAGAAAPRGALASDAEWKAARGEFRDAMRQEDWKVRRDAFLPLLEYDGEAAAEEILDAVEDEPNAAVVLAGLNALGEMRSLGAREVLVETARKGSGLRRLLVLVALARQEGPEVGEVLLEVARSRDAAAAAQAALALGRERRPEAVPVLLRLLRHRDWQVVAAAARTLGKHKEDEALPALAAALGGARGRARADLIAALERISGEAFGNDPEAWKDLAEGQDPATIEASPELAPSAFGIPIYGQRVVVCLDNSLRMGDPHPFDRDRLVELCDPPDGSAIPWFRMKTSGQFAHGHVKHLVNGLPRGTRLQIFHFNETVREMFDGLAPVNTANRNLVHEVLDGLRTDNGIATFTALNMALDVAGAGDAKAWRSGPDEILLITVNMPTTGEVVEADVVAAAISLKARLRMVPIHTVGIHLHPYDMCRTIAEQTGGTYVNLVE